MDPLNHLAPAINFNPTAYEESATARDLRDVLAGLHYDFGCVECGAQFCACGVRS